MYFNTKEFVMPYGQMKEVLTLVSGRAFIAGGAARSLILRNAGVSPGIEVPKPSDIDLFLFAPAWEADVYALLERAGYRDNGDGLPNAKTFNQYSSSGGFIFADPLGLSVQVVTPRVLGSLRSGEPKAVLETFAFTTEQFAVELLADGQSAKGTWTDAAVRDTGAKFIEINHINEDPIGMTKRMTKYAAKGYTTNRYEVRKLFERWSVMTDAERAASVESIGEY